MKVKSEIFKMNELSPKQNNVRRQAVAKAMANFIVAIVGPAGTGKTRLIPHIIEELQDEGFIDLIGNPDAKDDNTYTVCAPTHNAVMRLKKVGIKNPITIHRATTRPVLSELYKVLISAIEETRKCKSLSEAIESLSCSPHHNNLQALLNRALKMPAGQMLRLLSMYSNDETLKELGVNVDQFDGWRPMDELPNKGRNILIVDESSLVKDDQSNPATALYSGVIWIGDPHQLYPVEQDHSVFDLCATKLELTEVFRQPEGSGILDVAINFKNSEPIRYNEDVTRIEDIPVSNGVKPPPIISYRNTSRRFLNKAIREKLGYRQDTLYPGEVLIATGTRKVEQVAGETEKSIYVFNSSRWVIKRINEDGTLDIQIEGGSFTIENLKVFINGFEGNAEYDTDYKHPPIEFDFGYAMTCHKAQGNEWPEVIIYNNDLVWLRFQHPETVSQWGYTAVTRGKKKVFFYHCNHVGRYSPNNRVEEVPIELLLG